MRPIGLPINILVLSLIWFPVILLWTIPPRDCSRYDSIQFATQDFPRCFTLVGCLPPILPLSGGSYFCFVLVGCSRDFNYVCNPNYGCSLLLDCSGQMSKHPCNNIQQVPRPPVRDSSHSPYLFIDKVGTNSPCKHFIDMQVSGNESVHNLAGRLKTTEAVQMPVLPLT